jgi:hypothetical protein
MTALRISRTAGSQKVEIRDEHSGLVEMVEVEASDDAATMDTIVEDEPEVSGRYHYTP